MYMSVEIWMLNWREGKFRPKRGGVNCKGRDQRVEKMANIGILVLRGMPLQFTWNTVVD